MAAHAKASPAPRAPAKPRRAPRQDKGFRIAGSLKSLAGRAIGLAGTVVDMSAIVTNLLPGSVEQQRLLKRAGRMLHDLRSGAGVTIEDVSQALDLESPELLVLAERGKAALPFELILRLAAVLARNDPVPVILNLTKAYSPGLMRVLEDLGIGLLVEHARREHEIVSIYRARDRVRELSDAEFARVLKFMESALDLALDFTAPPRAAKPKAAKPRATKAGAKPKK